jgi:hypothetical protein
MPPTVKHGKRRLSASTSSFKEQLFGQCLSNDSSIPGECAKPFRAVWLDRPPSAPRRLHQPLRPTGSGALCSSGLRVRCAGLKLLLRTAQSYNRILWIGDKKRRILSVRKRNKRPLLEDAKKKDCAPPARRRAADSEPQAIGTISGLSLKAIVETVVGRHSFRTHPLMSMAQISRPFVVNGNRADCLPRRHKLEMIEGH